MNETNSFSIDESLRERFESAWINGEPVAINSCLPPPGDPLYLPTLEELVHIEMEFEWANSGQGPSKPRKIESYLEQFGELDSGDIVLRLIEQEIRCRKKRNDAPTINEYRQRFPTLNDRLSRITSVELDGQDTRSPQRPGKAIAPGGQMGRYTINDRQGEGGFGLVWQADDPKLGRRIAIKQLSGRLSLNREQRHRFVSEARIAARLEHPGIVPVYDLEQDEEGDQPYYTMKLVSGVTLDEAIHKFHSETRKTKTESVERLKLLGVFLSICRAMQYAHDQGVIHRDLKPQNFILGNYGETIILDWGLAKVMGDESLPNQETKENPEMRWLDREDITQAGSVMGTPAYMSPEQAGGRIRDIDERSDVYSLGVILFQIITGEFPFEASTTAEMIKKVVAGNPRPPRLIDASIPRPLQSICLKAMNRNLRTRYQSVESLAQDMERFLADEPVSCHPESVTERIGRWTRKHRRWVATATAMFALITIGSVVASVLINEQRKIARANELLAERAKQEETRAKTAAQDSAVAEKKARIAEQNQRQLAQWQLARSYIKDGQRNLEQVDVHTALLWYTKALALEQQDPRQDRVHRRRIHALLRRVPKLQQLFFSDQDDALIDVRFSIDQKRVLIIGRQRLLVRNIDDGQIEKTLEYGFPVRQACLSADQTRLVVGNESFTEPQLSLFDLENEKKLWTKPVQDENGKPSVIAISKLAISPSHDRIAVAAEDGRLQVGINFLTIFDGASGKNLTGQIKQNSRVSEIGFSPGGKRLVNGCWDNSATVWNAEDGKLIKRFDHNGFKEASDRSMLACAIARFSPDGKRILTSSGHKGFIWDAASYERLAEVAHGFTGRNPEIRLAAFSGKGERFATVDGVYRVRIWDTETGGFINEFKDHRGSINSIEFFKENLVLTASRDGTAKFWSPQTGDLINSVYHHGDSVTQGRIDRGGYRILTCSLDQTVRLWDSSQTQAGSFADSIKPGQILVQKFAQSDLYFATYSAARGKYAIDIWETRTRKRVGESIPIEDAVSSLQFDTDGTKLLVNCSTNLKRKAHFVQVFEAATAKPLTKKLSHAAHISSTGFGINGDRVFTASFDKTLVWWNLEDSSPLHSEEHAAGINTAALSPDGTFLLTGCRDKTAHAWSASSFERIGDPVKTSYPVTGFSIHPNNNDILISGYGTDGSLNATVGETMIYRRSTGRLWDLKYENISYFPARYRKDGKYFMTFGNGKQVVVYDASSGKKLCEINHRRTVLDANFHPNLPRFVSAASDKVVRVWEIPSGKPVSPEMLHIGIPAEAIFNPTGEIVVTRVAGGNVVRAWDSRTAEQATLDMNYSMFPEPIAFSPNGDRLFIGGNRPQSVRLEMYPGSVVQANRLIELLSAQKIDDVGGVVPLSTEEIRSRWEIIRPKR